MTRMFSPEYDGYDADAGWNGSIEGDAEGGIVRRCSDTEPAPVSSDLDSLTCRAACFVADDSEQEAA